MTNIVSFLSGIFSSAFVRFPVSIFFGICFSIYGMYMLKFEEAMFEINPNISVFFSLIFGYFCSLALVFISERKLYSPLKKIIFSSFSIPLAFGYYFLFPEHVSDYLFFDVVRHFIIIGSLLSLAFLGGFWKTTNEKPNGLLYFYHAAKKGKGAFLMAFFYGIIAFLGCTFFIESLNFLFDIRIYGDIYGYIFFVISGVISSLIFLGSLPSSRENFDYISSRWLDILGLYILLPLTIGYAGLLFAYIGKILLTQQWPEGFISWFIGGFSLVGISAFSILIPKIQNNKLVAVLGRIFGTLLIPAGIVLMMALWIRISEYGVTENRYLVGIFSIALIVSGMWLARSKQFDIRFPLALFSSLFFLSTFGPWGAESVAEWNQSNRLVQSVNGNISSELNIADMTEQEKKDFYSAASFFVERNKIEKVINYFPEDIQRELQEDDYVYAQKNIMEQYLGISVSLYGSFDRNYKDGIILSEQKIDISQYSYIQQFSRYYGEYDNNRGTKIQIRLDDTSLHTVDLLAITKQTYGLPEPIDKPVEYSDEKIDAVVYFQNISKYEQDYDATGYILWNEK